MSLENVKANVEVIKIRCCYESQGTMFDKKCINPKTKTFECVDIHFGILVVKRA